MEKKTAKFEIKDVLPIALTFVVAGIGIAYGLQIMGDNRDDWIADETLTFTCNTSANGGAGDRFDGCTNPAINATDDSITGVGKIPEKFPMIINVVIAAIIIGILVRYLMVRYQ